MTRRVPEAGTWGARLREARNAAGWDQTKLGAEVGVTYFTISAWELGDSNPSPASIAALAKLKGAFTRLAEERRAEDVAAASTALANDVARLGRAVALLAEDARPALRRQLQRVLAGEPG